MTERKITWFVATALDEIACTVNFTEMHIGAIGTTRQELEPRNGSVEMLYCKERHTADSKCSMKKRRCISKTKVHE